MPGRSPGQTPEATRSARSGNRASSPPTRVPCWCPAPGWTTRPAGLSTTATVGVGVDHLELHAGFGFDVVAAGLGQGDR